MNPRIKIISDTEVDILLPSDCILKLTITGEVVGLQQRGPLGIPSYVEADAEGLAALRDCLNCFEITKNFAALQDTSAVAGNFNEGLK